MLNESSESRYEADILNVVSSKHLRPWYIVDPLFSGIWISLSAFLHSERLQLSLIVLWLISHLPPSFNLFIKFVQKPH